MDLFENRKIHPMLIAEMREPFGYIPEGNANTIWLSPELVCIVESMPSEKRGFRQPVFKGIRKDKTALECQV